MTTDPLPLEPPPAVVPPASFLLGLARIALRQLARTRPELLSSTDGEAWVQRTAEVLAANLASGRFQTALAFQPADVTGEASLLNYAGQILTELLEESDRLDALRRGDTAAWQPVIYRMERMAYHGLGPRGREEWAAWEAREVAARACADMWAWLQEHPYPCDVPFNRWSATVLNRRLSNAVRKRIREDRHRAFSLDALYGGDGESTTRGDFIADDSLTEWLAQAANREALLQAIDCLEARTALVLRLWYFEQWPADEIAAHLSTSIGNVYVLRFRAIERLRQVVLKNERLGLAEALSVLEGEAQRARPAPDFGFEARESVA
jgi:RNA polymerase sigma factor (sigma-70 family)